MSACCECCVLSGRGLYDGSNPSPGDSYSVCERARVCVSLGVIRRKNNPLHLQCVRRKRSD